MLSPFAVTPMFQTRWSNACAAPSPSPAMSRVCESKRTTWTQSTFSWIQRARKRMSEALPLFKRQIRCRSRRRWLLSWALNIAAKLFREIGIPKRLAKPCHVVDFDGRFDSAKSLFIWALDVVPVASNALSDYAACSHPVEIGIVECLVEQVREIEAERRIAGFPANIRHEIL